MGEGGGIFQGLLQRFIAAKGIKSIIKSAASHEEAAGATHVPICSMSATGQCHIGLHPGTGAEKGSDNERAVGIRTRVASLSLKKRGLLVRLHKLGMHSKSVLVERAALGTSALW